MYNTDINVYRNCARDERDFVLDIDSCARDNAPWRHFPVDHKINHNFSLKMNCKMGGPDHHGEIAKSRQIWEKPTEEVLQEYKWEVEGIPDLKEIPLSRRNCPYTPGSAFWLRVPDGTVADGVVYARETMMEVYQKLYSSMAPALSFSPSFKKLKCKGSFTQNYSSCTWETQIWLVDPSVARSKCPKNEYIFECRRTSQDGLEAFTRLVQLIGIFLKEHGRAKMYASGCEIFPPVAPIKDLGSFAMPGIGSPLSHLSMMPMSDSRSSHPVTLNEDCVERMTVGIVERRHPECPETLALLAQCAVDKDNLDVLQESAELREAVQEELMKTTELSTCFNALTLLEYGVASPKGGLRAAARSLVVHSGYKGSDFEGPRSRAVEFKALRVMRRLASQLGEDREKTLLEIESDIRGKLYDEVFSKVQDIRTGLRTVNAF